MTHEEVVERLKEILAELERAALDPTRQPPIDFTEGDLVRSLGKTRVEGSHRVPPLGHVGVVRTVDLTIRSGKTILVEWESPWDGHTTPPVRRADTGWWMNPSNLEPA